ncbi:MAG: hypothetical protein HY553_06995 [Elusimicrobia bacterium]|nr:hypothetical protein [Elusimicrobiota bacterium]
MNRRWLRAATGAVGLLLGGIAVGALWLDPRRSSAGPAAVPQAVSFRTAPRVDAMKETAGVVARQDAVSQLMRYAFLYKDQPAVRALLSDVEGRPELRELWKASLAGKKSDPAAQKAASSSAMMDLLDKHTFRILGAVVAGKRDGGAGPPRGRGHFIPQAVFVSQKVPTEMVAERSYPVTVVMSNVGNTEWTKWDGYALGAENPEGNTRWGPQLIELGPGDKIAAGERATFQFNVTAPAEPGRYDFQWRMFKQGVKWFGLLTPNVVVNVVPNPSAGR